MAAPTREPLARCLIAVLLPVLLGWCVFPVPVRAEWQDFVPLPVRNTLVLDAAVTDERNETDLGGQRRTQSDLFVREKLTFVSDGYSYDPRFIQYHLLLAATLKQESYEDDAQGTIGTNSSGFDYDLRLHILPEHPYKLTLFVSRTEPIYKQYFSADSGAVSTRIGAMFNLRTNPYYLNLRYVENSREWARGSADLQIYSVNGRYSKEFGGGRKFSLTPFYDHSASQPSSGAGGSAENYGLGNIVDLHAASLQSNVTRNVFRQDQATGSPQSDGVTWLERLNVKLPWHFKSLFSYEYRQFDQAVAPVGTSAGEVRSVTSRDYELNLSHKLYNSLETIYRLRRDITASAGGDTASTSNSLAFNYAKSLPRGFLLAGANLSRSETDSAGRTTVANETHARLGVNEVFTTQQRDVDCGTVRVFLTDHAAGDRPVAVDFIAVPSPGARCDILVTGIPADFDETAPQDYTISYTLASGDYTLRADSYGYNVSLTLFNNKVNPYYSRSVTDSKVLSGSYPGIPFDGSVSTVGIVLGSLPLRLLGEYQQSDVGANSYRRWRGEVTCNQSVTKTTNITLTFSRTSTEYPEGSTAASPQAYTDDATRFSANLQQLLFRRSLVLSAGGTYSDFTGLIKSFGYSLHASLQWKIGKTTIIAGASGYTSTRESSVAPDSERARQYYYLNFKRELF